MSDWAPRVFWKEVGIAPVKGGFAIELDGRGVRTPAKAPLVIPTRALAEAVAAEWAAQEEKVDPATMPFTRLANSAIDKVAVQFAEVAQMLAAYGGSDLLCYRADHPQALVARQAEAWDPILAWAAEALEAPLQVGAGLMHVAQPEASLEALTRRVTAQSPFELAAFHDLVAMSGSLILAFAVTHGRLSADEAWALSRLDESWQAEQWGKDEEAESLAAQKSGEFSRAAAAFSFLKSL